MMYDVFHTCEILEVFKACYLLPANLKSITNSFLVETATCVHLTAHGHSKIHYSTAEFLFAFF